MQFLTRSTAILLLIAAVFSACKEPDGIGLDVLPEGEAMDIAWVDSFKVEAQTVYFDSVRTSGRATYAVGDFGDPIFGRVQSQMFSQFLLVSEGADPFNNSYQVDSVVLNLRYASAYGRVDKLRGFQQFGVFEVEEDLLLDGFEVSDTTYYSNDMVQAVSSTPLGTIDFAPDLLNPVPSGIDSTFLFPSLRIRLDSMLGVRIVSSVNLNDNDLFTSEFKGLNIRPINSSMSSDFGALLFFDMLSEESRLELFYHIPGDTVLQQYKFDMNNSNALFTTVEHDFSAEVIDAVNAGVISGVDDNLYIQGLAGTRLRVKFPTLRGLNELGAVAINKAELVLPVDEDAIDDFGAPSILTVNSINETDSAFPIRDQGELGGIDYYGGIYDSDKKEYVFNVARELQTLLSNPDEEDYGFYIAPLVAVDGKRVVLNGPNHPVDEEKLRLRLTYTIID